MKLEKIEDILYVYLDGELDHHIAKDIRMQIDKTMEEMQPKEVVLDFSSVTFMDSSGIGLVMGRYKLMQELGGSVIIQNPPAHIKKVMQLSGMDRLAKIVIQK